MASIGYGGRLVVELDGWRFEMVPEVCELVADEESLGLAWVPSMPRLVATIRGSVLGTAKIESVDSPAALVPAAAPAPTGLVGPIRNIRFGEDGR